MFQKSLLLSTTVAILAVLSQVVTADHTFTFSNRCEEYVNATVANVNCLYSSRCDEPGSGGFPNPAISYTGRQPHILSPGDSDTITINRQWNGRIFNQDGPCGGPHGENCTIAEFNLDTGDASAQQIYDISNAEGFTQSIQISVYPCANATCTHPDCGCENAYPPSGSRECEYGSPVRTCSAGDHDWLITFCP